MNRGMDALEREVIAPAEAAANAQVRLETIIHNHASQIAAGNHAVTSISDEVSREISKLAFDALLKRQISKR